MKQPNRLKLTSLKFISSVDVPAQETATARLLKRGGTSPLEVKATARVAKLSDELGLVFGWAITSKANGVDYIDLQGDNVVEEDLIKVAADWMTAGGAADTMHDREQDGYGVFCMPMTYEVAKAFYGDKIAGELGTYGLMVAIKPSAEDFQKFKSGELTGFSIDGMGERTPFEKATKSGAIKMTGYAFKQATPVVKASLYTNEVDGHQHEVHAYDDGSFYVCYATSAGAENSHSHGIVFEGGTLTILADSGHTHELAEGQPGIAIVAPDTIVLVQARAPSTTNQPISGRGAPKGASNSTPSNPVRTVNPQPEIKPMKHLLKMLTLFAALAPKEQDYVTTLGDDEIEPFLITKSPADRESIFKARDAADPIVFTGELTGLEVRKSDGELARKSAEQAELQAKKNAVLSETVASRDEAIEKGEVRKLATEILGGMKGEEATHDLIVRSLRKSGAKAEDIEKAFETLRAMRATSKVGKGAEGSTGSSPHDMPADEVEAMDALEKGLKKFCKEQSISISKMWTEGLKAFAETDEGAALKEAVAESVAQ